MITESRKQELKAKGYKVTSIVHGWYPVAPLGRAIIRGWASTDDLAWQYCDNHEKRQARTRDNG